MAESELTMCLCSFARHEQNHQIIEELSKQSCKPKIFVWNNDPEYYFEDDRADWVINSSQNVNVNHVVSLWQQAATPFVARMDDDLHFGDDDVLADMLDVSRDVAHRNKIVGAYGVRLYHEAFYENSHHLAIPRGHGQCDDENVPIVVPTNLEVDIVKGRIMVAHHEACHDMTAWCDHHHADLKINFDLAGRHRFFHVLAGCLWNRENYNPALEDGGCGSRLIDFPIDNKGYCDREGHYDKRNELCHEWAMNCLPNSRVRQKPEGPALEETPDH